MQRLEVSGTVRTLLSVVRRQRVKPGLFRVNRDEWNAYMFYCIIFWK